LCHCDKWYTYQIETPFYIPSFVFDCVVRLVVAASVDWSRDGDLADFKFVTPHLVSICCGYNLPAGNFFLIRIDIFFFFLSMIRE
jgi:hypothetical protein